MRILMLTSSPPYPPSSGGALRAYGLLRGLASAGHEVHLLTFITNEESIDPHLQDLCQQVVKVPMPQRDRVQRLRQLILSNRADIETRLYSSAMQDAQSRLLATISFDIVQYEGIEVATYLLAARATKPQAILCFDTFNAEAELQHSIYLADRAQPRRWPAAFYSYLQSRRLKHYEGDLCRAADLVLAVSAEDAAILRQYRSDGQVTVIPSGIHVNQYTPGNPSERDAQQIVFTGKMDYRPNVDAVTWFASEIWPHLENARFVIVGQQPSERVQMLASDPRITITGRVESVQPFLQSAGVYVAPLRMGSGTRLKILEAMACGCAVVATSLAAAGLSERARAALHIADGAADFAAAVRDLMYSAERRAAMGIAAREAVQAEYDWSVIVPHLLRTYEETHDG